MNELRVRWHACLAIRSFGETARLQASSQACRGFNCEPSDPQGRVGKDIADPLRRLLGLTEAGDRVQELADRASLSREPHQLSGARKARVDSVEAAILKLLHRLRRDLGLSYLLISHDSAYPSSVVSP